VPQVGYLPELYEDAQSKKYIKKKGVHYVTRTVYYALKIYL
jgi:hypothetical protein